jgi:hypothetical protein
MIFSNYVDFNEFCSKNNYSKEEGIKIVFEKIDCLSKEIKKIQEKGGPL